ncbi:hypothetical protein Ocin01_13430 [Orchesella cincta]|uniref:C-type lectin domain-containing protein n=1 Tax=Orchesella cincta TaxID=48709 RepID=A0A1D2MJZ6_ORCCI|nr:hypothetical protein Ocin01_13430 [Orchesella cincta]
MHELYFPGESEINTVALGSVGGKTYFVNDYHRGIGDLDNDGKFHWSNSMKQVKTFDNLGWSAGRSKDEEGQQQCLVYSSNNHGSAYYFKRSCHREHYSLCESSQPLKEIAPHFKQFTRESQEFIKLGNFEGKAYYGDVNLRSWNGSSQFCSRQGFQLAILTTRVREGFLKSACRMINYDGFWVADKEVKSKTIQDKKCPCYDPHDDFHYKRSCESKHFTLCEDINQKTTARQTFTHATTLNVVYIDEKTTTESISPILKDAIGDSANHQNDLNIKKSPESTTELYSEKYFIAGLFIVIILATTGMLLRRRLVKPTLVYQTHPSDLTNFTIFSASENVGKGRHG